MKNKQILIEVQERKKFLDTYVEFDLWLKSLGFRNATLRESGSAEDNYYSHYKEYIDSLYGVEHIIHDVLDLSIRFIRDKHEHKFMFVGDLLGGHSEVMNFEKAKEEILQTVRKLRDKKIMELTPLLNI